MYGQPRKISYVREITILYPKWHPKQAYCIELSQVNEHGCCKQISGVYIAKFAPTG